MKKVFLLFVLVVASIATIQAKTIRYYGSKSTIFKSCVGDCVTICKEVIFDEGGIGNLPIGDYDPNNPINGLSLDSEKDSSEEPCTEAQTAIVIYDGVEYVIPVDAINLEDGSIDPSKL